MADTLRFVSLDGGAARWFHLLERGVSDLQLCGRVHSEAGRLIAV